MVNIHGAVACRSNTRLKRVAPRRSCEVFVVTPCPAIDADTGAKSRAFTHALQALDRHSPYFDFAELSDCLASIVPGNHVTAQTQASDAKLNMRDSPFNVTYISPECFLHHDKTPANPALLHAPASTRPAGIQFLRVSFLVDVNDPNTDYLCRRLIMLPSDSSTPPTAAE